MRPLRILWLLTLSTAIAYPVRAQGFWDAILMVDPVPSPYLSDWEANPNFGSLTVFSGAAGDQSVRLAFNVVDGGGRLLASGSSEPQLIPADAPAIFNDPFEIAGSTTHDTELEDQMRRTGRIPEGDYRACVAVVDLNGFQLAEDCESFSVVYPDPPLLVAPYDGESVSSEDFFLQWMPSQVPVGFNVSYVLEVAEIRPGQLPYEALEANILHLHEPGVLGSQVQYPLSARPLENGARYAWRVRALDVNGYPVSTNDGSSEIWTFTYEPPGEPGGPEPPGSGAPSTFTVQLRTDASQQDTSESGGAFILGALNALCATRDQWAAGDVDSLIDLSVAAPFFRDDDLVVDVYYAVDSLGLRESQQWAIHGRSDQRNWEYFARGDCDGPRDETAWFGALTRLHWIAARPVQYRFSDYLQEAFGWNQGPGDRGEEGNPAHEGIEMDFGAGVLSLRSTTVGEGDLFPAERDFFQNHDFDVLPGLNAYGVVWLPEGSVWSWLKEWGWDQNKFELQGFVGLDTRVSAGVEYEGARGGEVDVTAQQKFLELRLLFPERTPQRLTWIESMRAGLEFSVEDTLTTGVGPGTETKAGFDIFTRLLWIWEINDEVTIVWTGGLDFNAERDAAKSGWERKVDLVLTGECQCVWESPFGVGRWWIGNPKLEMHYTIVGDPALSVAGTFETGWGDAPPFVAGGSLTWERKPLNLPPGLREVYAIAMQTRDDRTAALERLQMLDADGAPLAELNEAREQLRRAQQLDDAAWDEYMRLVQDPSTPDIQLEGWDWKHPEWRVRFTAGNVGVLELLDFIRSLW